MLSLLAYPSCLGYGLDEVSWDLPGGGTLPRDPPPNEPMMAEYLSIGVVLRQMTPNQDERSTKGLPMDGHEGKKPTIDTLHILHMPIKTNH